MSSRFSQEPLRDCQSHDPRPLRLEDRDYLRFRQLLLDRCGLYFPENRRAELEYRLHLAFASSPCAGLNEFYSLLKDGGSGGVEMDSLINAVTISETHFFRDTPQMDALCNEVLPEIIERRRPQRTLRIWSAGCASGEEPYSLVMLLREYLPDFDQWSILVLGTDISSASLSRARNATYGSWAFREDRALQMRPRYFRKNGNRYELQPEIRNRVFLKPLNLVDSNYPSVETNTHAMDLILCRNVTIYFSEAVTRWVADRFYDALVDGGWLVVGHSEPCLDIYRRFQVRNFPNTVLYQRPSEKSGLAESPARSFPAPSAQGIPPIPVSPPRPTPRLDTGTDLKCNADNLILQAPDGCAENPMDQIQELIEYGRSEEARALLQRRVAEQPRDSQACSLLGRVYANLGNWEEASRWCLRAIERNALSLDAYYTLALVFQHEARIDKAIEAMKKVVYIDRNSILGHYSLAHLYRESRQPAQAQKSLSNALRLLAGRSENEVIAASSGITIGRLREAILGQQKNWSSTG